MVRPHLSPLFAVFALATLCGPVAGQEDITVLVLKETSYLGPLLPVSGAWVTLRGTDPASLPGLMATTDASGEVVFSGVSGPYSVTAQSNVVHSGITTRVASSLIDISPVAAGIPPLKTIGLLLFDDFDDPPVIPDATLSGMILNPPPLLPGEILGVLAVENGTGESVEWAFPYGNSYSMAIPSGVSLDCYAIHRKSFGASRVIGTVIQAGVGSVGTGGTKVQDFDFGGPLYVPWNLPVQVEVANVPTGVKVELLLAIHDVATLTGLDLHIGIFDGYFPLPPASQTINLPNVAGTVLSPYRVDLECDADGPAGNQEGAKVLAVPPTSKIVLDLFSMPTILQPAGGATLTLSELDGLSVQFAESPTGSFRDNGLNIFSLASEDGCQAPPGIDEAIWVIMVPGGTQIFDLPPHSQPMFVAGQSLSCGVDQWRLKSFPLSYAGFFDGNLEANLLSMESSFTEQYSTEVGIGISLSDDTYCTSGSSASGCQATISSAGTASATAASGFDLTASEVEGNKDGLFFFGVNGRQANPWGNGTSYQCVVPPVKRGGLLSGTGTAGQCDGSFTQDLNARWTAKPNQNPGAGAIVQAQLWYRDPFNTSDQTTSLSDAIEFCLAP